MFRRRRLPDDLVAAHEAFSSLIPALEGAKAALTSSVPGTRLPGRPLAETLLEFEEDLAVVREGMPAWRAPAVEDVWRAADDGLRDALASAERLRVEAPEPAGFEGLIGTIGDLLAPLDAFHAAAERFRDLRR
jgi:hypothetical protein